MELYDRINLAIECLYAAKSDIAIEHAMLELQQLFKLEEL